MQMEEKFRIICGLLYTTLDSAKLKAEKKKGRGRREVSLF